MNSQSSLSRRMLLGGAVAAAATSAAPSHAASAVETNHHDVLDDFTIRNKKIRQSVMGWCFKPMPVPELIRHCAEIGLEAIEGISPEFYPEAHKQGLKISLVSSHGFAKGPVDPANHAECISKLKSSIDKAVEFGAPSVITFTGMSLHGIIDSTAEKNCLACWKKVIRYAEEKQITLVLEHLNSRDDSHPMKGHPGYFGDDVDRCVDLVKRMDSDRFKLLFDVYHVQVMNGDVIRRIRNYHPYIGHYHTAGNPGRGELDQNQEINYPAVMRAILQTGYDLFVAQEFIPTWDDPVRALRHSAMVCDVT
ncbi:MAG: TIM barrel protein [Fuerstiella sp.]|nr:TIM barrel protein [Fuerstiella sp.]